MEIGGLHLRSKGFHYATSNKPFIFYPSIMCLDTSYFFCGNQYILAISDGGNIYNNVNILMFVCMAPV